MYNKITFFQACSEGVQGELHVSLRIHLGDDVDSTPLPVTVFRLGAIFQQDSSAFSPEDASRFVADLTRFEAQHNKHDNVISGEMLQIL